MQEDRQDFSKVGFVRTFIVPALWMFLVPVLGLMFFIHAQSDYDEQAREGLLQQIASDQTLNPEERAQSEEVIRNVPFSRMMRDPEFAAGVDSTVRFDYATFRWMIRIAALCIAGGIGAFLFVGLCVMLSMKSQRMQYLSLSSGWHVLRICSALQTIGQGALLVALSYWVTSLWFNVYVPKLIAVVGFMAVCAVGLVLKAIFTRPKTDFVIEGQLIEKDEARVLWEDLTSICDEVGTEPPDQIIAGIDDSFFVTEQPVTVGDSVYKGRTLFVSLSLLKQLDGSEADAVMAHEMAHFSGNDTVYSRKIAPLLIRYGNYLQALHEGGITIPIYHFMLCFRVLFELSLGKLSREREFRADAIAAQVTSPEDFSSGLMKIVAFSNYRQSVEKELFEQEQTSQIANITDKIDTGFNKFALSFVQNEDNIGSLQTSHPFDSHPPISERTAALGVELDSLLNEQVLSTDGDGTWYHNIASAEKMERQQWEAYEERFRNFHEQALCYRYLPANDQERQIVVKHFPEVEFEGKDGLLVIDHEKIAAPKWAEPLYWSEIDSCAMQDSRLDITTKTNGVQKLATNRFGKQQQELLAAFQNYYGRHLTAVESQKQTVSTPSIDT